MWVGAAFFGLGLLAVAFVAYQLWGTALYEEQAQAHLGSELSHQLHHPLPTKPAEPDGTTHSGRAVVATRVVPTVPAPALGQPVGELGIPKIGLLDTIVEGVGEAQLQQGPGHYPGTALPGETGNVAIAGHRTTYAHPFYNLDALSPGDSVYVLTTRGLFHYTVNGTQVVAPTDVAVLDSTPGAATLTLTTCNPRYSAATRLVVTATFDGSPTPATPAAHVATAKPPTTTLAGDTATGLGGASAPLISALLWGVVGVAVAVAGFVAWGRVGGRRRLIVLAVGVPLFAVVLVVFFEHVSLALPGSY